MVFLSHEFSMSHYPRPWALSPIPWLRVRVVMSFPELSSRYTQLTSGKIRVSWPPCHTPISSTLNDLSSLLIIKYCLLQGHLQGMPDLSWLPGSPGPHGTHRWTAAIVPALLTWNLPGHVWLPGWIAWASKAPYSINLKSSPALVN